MGEATMEERLAAITASLNESRRLLASCARRSGVKENEEQVATTASSATTTMASCVQDRVREKPETKLGVLHESTVLTPATPTRYSTFVLTSQEGSVAGARVVNIDQPCSNSFPRFDGTNPGLWRVHCLEYFIRFNINKCLWVIAATMHMDGKAKVWYDAYRLRQTVGDWSDFMDHVESHFVDADLPASIPILGTAHPIHASEDISPTTTTKCVNESPTEVMVMDKAAEPVVVSYKEVLTHVGDVSLFLEPCVEPAQVVFSEPHPMEFEDDVFTVVGGFSLFLELSGSADGMSLTSNFKEVICNDDLPDEAEHKGACMQHGYEEPDEVLTHVGGLSLFLEFDLDNSAASADEVLHDELPGKCPSKYVVVSAKSVCNNTPSWTRNGFSPGVSGIGKSNMCCSHDNGQEKKEGTCKEIMRGCVGGIILYDRNELINFPCMEQGATDCKLSDCTRSRKDNQAVQLATARVLNNMPPWGRGGFSPGNTGQQQSYQCREFYSFTHFRCCFPYKKRDPGVCIIVAKTPELYTVRTSEMRGINQQQVMLPGDTFSMKIKEQLSFQVTQLATQNWDPGIQRFACTDLSCRYVILVCRGLLYPLLQRKSQLLTQVSKICHAFLAYYGMSLTSPWDPDDWCSLQFFAHGLQYLLDLCEFWCWNDNKLERNEKMNVGDAILGLIGNRDVLLVYTSLWPIEMKMGMDIIVANNVALFLCHVLNEALKLGHAYEMEDPLETLFVVTLPHDSQSRMHTTKYDFLMWPSKHVQMPWDPGDVHNDTSSARLTQCIECLCLERPWDPGIIVIQKAMSGDLNAEVGTTKCCNLIKPLLGDKQCFLGAVMSYPSI